MLKYNKYVKNKDNTKREIRSKIPNKNSLKSK